MSTYLPLEEQVNIQVTAKNSNYNYKKGANKYMELVYQVFYYCSEFLYLSSRKLLLLEKYLHQQIF